MKTSIEVIDEIIKIKGEEWKKYLNDGLKTEDDGNLSEEMKLFEYFIEAYKEDIYKNNKKVLEQVEKKINNDLLYTDMKEYVDKLMEAYTLIYPLRVLEVRDKEKVLALIDYIFNEGIIRYNPNIEEKYKEYGLEVKEELENILGVLDSISTFVVANNLCKNAIGETIQYNLRLSHELSKYIAEIIDKNFEKLRTIIIVKKLY